MTPPNHQITPTSLSLPKGGGAIQGIGETFQADEFTGTATLSLPLPTTPCRGFEPQLSLDYSSGGGNGVFGLGFGLSVPNIARKTAKGQPHYTEADTFILSGAEDLVPLTGDTGTETLDGVAYTVIAYRPRVEGHFAKIEQWLNPMTGESFWQVVSRENVTSLFGPSPASRITDPAQPSHIFQWLLAETFDAEGNQICYHYQAEDEVVPATLEGSGTQNVPQNLSQVNRTQGANKYLARIQYGNQTPRQAGRTPDPLGWHFEVVFDYGQYTLDPSHATPYTPTRAWASRPDPFSTYHAGFEIRTDRLCQHILLFHRFADLDPANPTKPEPRLVHVTRLQYQEDPTLTLLTQVEEIGYRFENGTYQTQSLPPLDLDYTPFQPHGHDFEPIQQTNGQAMPGLNGPPYSLLDLYGEGTPGVFYSDGRATFYWEPGNGQGQPDHGKPNGGSRATQYAPPQAPLTFPLTPHLSAANQRLMDLSGNARLDLVLSSPTATGYYEAQPDRSWRDFQPFPSFPSEFHHPDARLVDLSGDGLADLLMIETERVRLYPSTGPQGFAPPLTAPRPPDLPTAKPDSAKEVLRFVDLFGTGRQHWARIRNGSVECWPNLGYGRFGPKVTLANAPHFGPDFDTARLFIVDLDGSGAADLAYLYPDRVEVYFNQSGNSFSQTPFILYLPSTWDRLDQISFADVHGQGYDCLLFSEDYPSPRQWYYDFCQGQKPYLLKQINNNLGAISRLSYGSSTHFYRQDKAQGQPWLTNLPFPVQVLIRTENQDLVSQTTLVSTYTYHHGYYDGVEREFRGFGLVERQDAETLAAEAQAYDVPPILTKTWYHNGAWTGTPSLSQQYRADYFQGDAAAHDLPDSVFDPKGQAIDETSRHEARRALKGQILREEVYGLDGTEAQDKPYAVSETNYQVTLLQGRGDNKYEIYFVHPREMLNYEYERDPTDPQMSHDFVLQVDQYGNVLRSCAVAYGRRPGSGVLPEQLSLKVTAQEDGFINQSDATAHLLGLPLESKTYEILGLTLSGSYFSFAEIETYLADNLGTAATPLLSWERHYYWDPDQAQALPHGQTSPQALLHRTETAVFSPAQVEAAFDGALTAAELASLLPADGGYVLQDGYWWNPGLAQTYQGTAQFCLPHTVTNPFDHATTMTYDAYHLALARVQDAVGNETVVQAMDYQTVQPQQIRDPNHNLSEVRFDPLGLVQVTSFYGTEDGQAVGFQPLSDYQDPANPDLDDMLANPQTYLQGAATYVYYDLFTWQEGRGPIHMVTLAAETYASDTRVQTSLTYSDGFGRQAQAKTKVEAGEAFVILPDGSVGTETTTDRWLTSGRTVYNNKGNAVKQYEPYYIKGHAYVDQADLNQFGVSPTIFYDPLQRVVRVETPKGFFSKIAFTPWRQKHYDENDTVIDSPYYQDNIDSLPPNDPERQALEKAAVFYDTPTDQILDNLGRVIADIRRNKTSETDPVTDLTTETEWDIVGNQIAHADPRLAAAGQENFRMTYNLTSEVLKTVSADAGAQWRLNNVLGQPIYSRDGRGFAVSTTYDALQRPTESHVQGGPTSLDHRTERLIYGDSLDESGDPVVPNPETKNLRGQLYQHYDQAGLVQIDQYTIQGLPSTTQRQFREAYQAEVNWASGSETLQPTQYQSHYQYDALSRITAETDPDGNVHQPSYHLSGRLNRVEVTHVGQTEATSYIDGITYDPKGQRLSLTYGNGLNTDYAYERETFRLIHLLTQRSSDDKTLQDLSYTYDPVGNITQIADGALETVFNKNQAVQPESSYTYDALYRLIEAEGREHPALSPLAAQSQGDFAFLGSIPPINDHLALQAYTRRYSYDEGHNLFQIQHQGATTWTQTLTVSATSNRAVDEALTDDPTEVDSFFDADGNQTGMVGLAGLAWNYRANIAQVTIIERSGEADDAEYYVYDGRGQRVRKVTERYANGGAVLNLKETIYLGAVEIEQSRQDETLTEERRTLRVRDDEDCLAMRLRWTVGSPPSGVSNPQTRYQLSNHLGSAVMEVDAQGQIISYEEYFPYGGTAIVAGRSTSEVQLKRYRYSGKERDAVTGLYYYGMRYYAPWLGRWLSPDPAGTVDGLNLYGFVGGNPITFVDDGGMLKDEAGGNKIKAAASTSLEGSHAGTEGNTATANPSTSAEASPAAALSPAAAANPSTSAEASPAEEERDAYSYLKFDLKSATPPKTSKIMKNKLKDLKITLRHYTAFKDEANKYNEIKSAAQLKGTGEAATSNTSKTDADKIGNTHFTFHLIVINGIPPKRGFLGRATHYVENKLEDIADMWISADMLTMTKEQIAQAKVYRGSGEDIKNALIGEIAQMGITDVQVIQNKLDDTFPNLEAKVPEGKLPKVSETAKGWQRKES